MRLLLVRHAEPEDMLYHNLPPGPGLGPKGVQQAQAIAKYLHPLPINRIYSSDYKRTIETAAPFQETVGTKAPFSIIEAIREREPSMESHESLQERVTNWFSDELTHLEANPSVIFSHCGPINMILEYLDPEKRILSYPYQCPYGCLTPLGAIWNLEIECQRLVNGKLIVPWKS